jgi:hypothetical protein
MGQRLQAFIYFPNPVHSMIKRYKSLLKYNGDKGEITALNDKIEKYKTAFGSVRNTVAAYHHQWCYGRSSLIAAHNILEFIKNVDEANSPFSEQSQMSEEELLPFINNLLGLFTSKVAKLIGRYGYEHFHLLNFNEPYMREDYTAGDCNDGIFIVNTFNKSYAFINPGNGCDPTVSQLAELEPVSATTYLRLYYPEAPDDSKTVNIPESVEDQNVFYNNNKRINKLFIKSFSDFEVMTKKDLRKMFPLTYSKNFAQNQNVKSNHI